MQLPTVTLTQYTSARYPGAYILLLDDLAWPNSLRAWNLDQHTVLTLESAGCIDFDNTHRQTAGSVVLPFTGETLEYVHLHQGVYLVEFNEFIRTPRNIMGQIFVRSSLFRSGIQIHAGVVDSGYQGVIGAMLKVENSFGLRVYKDARLAQMVFHELTEPTEGYSGQYQGSAKL